MSTWSNVSKNSGSFSNVARNSGSFTNVSKSSGVAEVDYTFQDATGYTFQDADTYVFVESTASTTWSNQSKN